MADIDRVPTDANKPRIRDAAGDAAGAITGEAVTNITPQKATATPVSDTVVPELLSAAVERTRLVLTYNEVLNETSAPAAGAFAVRVESVARSVEDVSVEGHAVVLTLASTVTSSDAVTLSYMVPTDADAPRIQDVAGNDAGAISSRSVTNSTPAVSSDATLISVDYAHRIVSLGDNNCAKQSPGGLFPPDSGAMTLTVGSSVESVSLFARTSNAYATVAYGSAADADGTTCGHQVTLAEGDTVVSITVTAEDGITTKPYYVTITRSDNIHNNPAAGVVAISGVLRVGETLTAMPFGIVDADGLSNATFSYQWIANDGNTDAEIEGANAKTYTLVAGDVGKTIRVRAGAGAVVRRAGQGGVHGGRHDPRGVAVRGQPARGLRAGDRCGAARSGGAGGVLERAPDRDARDRHGGRPGGADGEDARSGGSGVRYANTAPAITAGRPTPRPAL